MGKINLNNFWSKKKNTPWGINLEFTIWRKETWNKTSRTRHAEDLRRKNVSIQTPQSSFKVHFNRLNDKANIICALHSVFISIVIIVDQSFDTLIYRSLTQVHIFVDAYHTKAITVFSVKFIQFFILFALVCWKRCNSKESSAAKFFVFSVSSFSQLNH